ncbi:hypothetical protein FRX31_014479 [Thalictrum thalictroides]|uniref:Uncharacterized protein n=1 Tax=Thalictrum thalictroides TaxID=46969 RepID=A0A7J6WHN4_THATH|nr:hypothetical protein FRX31_014479 [Thalictrum thalictroides]
MKDRRTCGKIAYGLGYDSSMDDYKVIRILYYYNIREAEDKIKDYESDIHVYSMRTNSYMRIPVHWVGRRDPKTTTSEFSLRIVSFNVVNEEFEEIQMPDSFDSTTPFELGVFEGCLCIYRRNLPFSPYTMALGGIGNFTLYANKKPQVSARDVAKLSTNVANPDETRPESDGLD